jgi:SAM-dependent methyltransferase
MTQRPSPSGYSESAVKPPSQDDIVRLLESCSPGEALWRAHELAVLRTLEIRRPILEVGCGSGVVPELLGLRVDLGIDLSAESARRAASRGNTYVETRCTDIHALVNEEQRFETILANCVLEHVVDLEQVLLTCRELITPLGVLVATVPLRSMNDHLLYRGARYSELRRRQLIHHNLLSAAEWEDRLANAGFSPISVRPYLSGRGCRRWDLVDFPGTIGLGRYRLSSGARLAIRSGVPLPLRTRLKAFVARVLLSQMDIPRGYSPPCGILLLAAADPTWQRNQHAQDASRPTALA